MKNQIEKLQDKIKAIKAVNDATANALISAAKMLQESEKQLVDTYTSKSEKAAIRRAVRAFVRAVNILHDCAGVYGYDCAGVYGYED